jgi:hypothetical protein
VGGMGALADLAVAYRRSGWRARPGDIGIDSRPSG